MGYSGLIYAAIVAAWAAFLVPRWVRRNEEVERAREVDTVRGVRVLQRRAGPPQAPHGGVVVPPAASSRTPAFPASVEDVFAVAARRRRRMLVMLLATVVVSLAAAYMGQVPGWTPAVPVLLTAFFFVVARRAVVTQARRRRAMAQRRAARLRAESRQAAAEAAAAIVAEEGVGRKLVIPDEIVAAVADPDGWSPVPVPLPTYLTKPKAPRAAARKIDLSVPGAWTSGRLDPASSIELPRRDPVEQPSAPVEEPVAEQEQERRRAVGD